MTEEITLTPQELEDIKDEVKFRTKVLIDLKSLCQLPKKVTILETKVLIYGTLTIALILGFLGLALKVLAGGPIR